MKILVPFDFSKESVNALKLAREMALDLGMYIKVFFALDYPTFPNEPNEQSNVIKAMLIKTSKEEIVKVLDKIFEDISEVEIEISMKHPASEIVKATYDKHIAYTILGRKQQEFPNHIGSVTNDIVRFAAGSVITVLEEMKFNSINNILLVTDFSNTPLKTISSIKQLQQSCGAQITLLRVNTKDDWQTSEETLRLSNKFCKTHGLSNTRLEIINDDSLEQGVVNLLKYVHFDLVSMKINLASTKLDLVNTHLSVERLMDHLKIPIISNTFKNQYK